MDRTYGVKQLRELADKLEFEISDAVLDKVIDFSKFKIYSKGAILANSGEKASYAGIVMNGVVRSYYIDGDGNDITQWFATEGRICMDSGMYGFDETTATWEAIEESTVMLFEVKKMKALIYSDEYLKSLWIDLLEGGMRYKIYRESGFLTENATERYLKFRENFPDLLTRVPQRYIATYLGIQPESLSRIKSVLKEG